MCDEMTPERAAEARVCAIERAMESARDDETIGLGSAWATLISRTKARARIVAGRPSIVLESADRKGE